MANISEQERQVKAQCLLDAFETLIQESEKKGQNLASMKAIIELANEDERMQEFKTLIGEKSVYSKAKNSVYPPIVAAVKKWNDEYKVDAAKANKKAKTKLQNMSEKLADVEATVILLQEKNHELTRRLENRIQTISRLEQERNEFAAEVAKLRKTHESA
jgi:hypothetical protein